MKKNLIIKDPYDTLYHHGLEEFYYGFLDSGLLNSTKAKYLIFENASAVIFEATPDGNDYKFTCTFEYGYDNNKRSVTKTKSIPRDMVNKYRKHSVIDSNVYMLQVLLELMSTRDKDLIGISKSDSSLSMNEVFDGMQNVLDDKLGDDRSMYISYMNMKSLFATILQKYKAAYSSKYCEMINKEDAMYTNKDLMISSCLKAIIDDIINDKRCDSIFENVDEFDVCVSHSNISYSYTVYYDSSIEYVFNCSRSKDPRNIFSGLTKFIYNMMITIKSYDKTVEVNDDDKRKIVDICAKYFESEYDYLINTVEEDWDDESDA